MKNIFKAIAVIGILIVCYFIYTLYSIIPQGHGFHANYNFSESKYNLEQKIDSLIKHDPIIKRKPLDPTPYDNYYNKDAYFTIIIDSTSFCFRYYGDSLNWNNSIDSSEIFIASLHNYGRKEMTIEEYLEIVEKNFIDKLKHITE